VKRDRGLFTHPLTEPPVHGEEVQGRWRLADRASPVVGSWTEIGVDQLVEARDRDEAAAD